MVTGMGLVSGPPHAGVGRLASSDAVAAGGFTPGVILAARYRIIGLLGRGGMGEVYRADDLKLGQAVALKFLPRDLEADPVRRERFYAEVRIARQISHPSVCRVYDIAEVDGRHFLSMEYVDGEDLASLLKRIGHLPGSKALEIARQLCAGLAAAHEKGVLHRDLKPANVMLDGRGHVRITDFGLAVAIGHEEEGQVSGTPAYMAPEQLAGGAASIRSDIYALGLVLYELYTGRSAFTASTLAELRAQKEREAPATPADLGRDFDPVVERVIQRCIDRDPRHRPSSVLQVAAALPGGDPLAAALAAGETPSPEMVAASASHEGLQAPTAWALLALLAIAAAATVVLADHVMLMRRVAFDRPPAAMLERARAMLKIAGHTAPPVGSAYGFAVDVAYLEYVRRHDPAPDRWQRIRPEAVRFWYRESPRPLARIAGLVTGVHAGDPPLLYSGEVRAYLDAQGRLVDLVAVPPQIEAASPPASRVDWTSLFREAGLEPSDWTPAAPEWTPQFYADSRAGWTGSLSGPREVPARVEAASYGGAVVHFSVIKPWTVPTRTVTLEQTAGQTILNIIAAVLLVILMAGGLLFARRNVRLGRGDRRGASRLAAFVLGVHTAGWLLLEDHVAQFWELYLFVTFAGFALFVSALFWILYVAVEPSVRRNWPGVLVSWTRLLAGEFGDPLVGRDLLIGCAAGACIGALLCLRVLGPGWLGLASETPQSAALYGFEGIRHYLAMVAFGSLEAILTGLALLFFVFLCRLLLRNQYVALAAVGVLLGATSMVTAENPWFAFLLAVPQYGILLLALARIGLVAAVAAVFVANLLLSSPGVLPFSAWYAAFGMTSLAVVAALALFAFSRALAGRPAFGRLSLEV